MTDDGADSPDLVPQNPKAGRLSHRDRQRILDMHESGYSHDEIAEATQRTTGLIKKTLAGLPAQKKKKRKAPPTTRRGATRSAAARPAPARPPQPPADANLRHLFWLRPDTLIELELPADLRGEEARRLANYLLSLWFGGSGSRSL